MTDHERARHNAAAHAADDVLERVWIARQITRLAEGVELLDITPADLAPLDPHTTAPFDVDALRRRLEAEESDQLMAARRRRRGRRLRLVALPVLVAGAVVGSWVAGTWHGLAVPW